MPAFAGPAKGRSIAVKRGVGGSEVLIAAVRTKSLSISGEAIDVTNDDDAGIRKLLPEPAEVQVSMSVSGVAKNNTLLQESLSTTDRQQSMTFEFPGGDKISGEFNIITFSINGEYNGAATFEAEFQSAGLVSFTPGA